MKKGFALIYVLLFVILLLIAVSATWFTGLADLRLSQSSTNLIQARELAKAGIDDGWVKFRSTEMLGNVYPRPYDYALSYPIGACGTTGTPLQNPIVYRQVIAINGSRTPSSPHLQDPVGIASYGAYDYRIYTGSCLDNVRGGATTIEGIGYYKGSKITLEAVVTHGADPEQCTIPGVWTNESDCENIGGGTWYTDHSGDYITISQVGPSK